MFSWRAMSATETPRRYKSRICEDLVGSLRFPLLSTASVYYLISSSCELPVRSGFLESTFPTLSWFCGQNCGESRWASSFGAGTGLVGTFWTFTAQLQKFVWKLTAIAPKGMLG